MTTAMLNGKNAAHGGSGEGRTLARMLAMSPPIKPGLRTRSAPAMGQQFRIHDLLLVRCRLDLDRICVTPNGVRSLTGHPFTATTEFVHRRTMVKKNAAIRRGCNHAQRYLMVTNSIDIADPDQNA